MDDKTKCGMQKDKLAVHNIGRKDKTCQAVSDNTLKTIWAIITVLFCMAGISACQNKTVISARMEY